MDIVLELTDSEAMTLIRSVAADFQGFVVRYDERKYPPKDLEALRHAFRRSETVQLTDVEAALVWKYGHTGKARYPDRQRQLANRIAELWKSNAIQPDEHAEAAVARWQQLLGPTSFITVCFLLHLCQPDSVPILDQHNFRSVNFHLAHAAGRTSRRATPRRVEDLTLVRDFIGLVHQNWSTCISGATPSRADIDRYLMMHGKSLKAQKRRDKAV
jgi:hypothetical protein